MVFDLRREPTALLMLLRQLCLARPPLLVVLKLPIAPKAPSTAVPTKVLPVRGVSGGSPGETARGGLGIATFALE